MAKKTIIKKHPLTFFREANEARQKLSKAQYGIEQDGIGQNRDNSKPIGATVGIGKFSGGFNGTINNDKISNTSFNAGYTNPRLGLNVNTGYTPANNKVNAGINYNTTLGKNKIPLKVGVTYNKIGGIVKSKKK